MLWRVDRAAKYEQELMTTFVRFHYVLGTHVMRHFALVLTPDPTVPAVE